MSPPESGLPYPLDDASCSTTWICCCCCCCCCCGCCPAPPPPDGEEEDSCCCLAAGSTTTRSSTDGWLVLRLSDVVGSTSPVINDGDVPDDVEWFQIIRAVMLFDDDDVDSSADDGCRWLGEVEAPEGGGSGALLLNGWAGSCCCCCCWQPEVVEEEEEEEAKLAKMRRSS